MTKILLGSHVSMAKPDYLLASAQSAVGFGANTFMIYTGAPQNSVRAPLDQLKIKEFHQYLNEHEIKLTDLVVHAPYIINLATNDPYKHAGAVQILQNEIYRTTVIGCQYLVLHPGSAGSLTKTQGIANIARAINTINLTNRQVIICLETMAGKHGEIGGTFDELSQIINLINDKQLIGVCLDTCHINDAGYDNHDIDTVLHEFDKKIGLKYLKVIHLNDSKNTKGTNKDRHENIGYGTIGFQTLLKYTHDQRLVNIPKILETPK
jgi:deoxyribonuclease-4